MSVIRRAAHRFAWSLAAAALAMAGALVKLGLAGSSLLAERLEALGQKVGSRRAAISLAAASEARAPDRWRTAFDAAPLGMARANLEGRIEAANEAFRSLLGEPERAILGRRLSAFVYPDDLAMLGGAGNPGNSPKGVAKAEVRLVCAGGRLSWCEVASSLVRDGRGKAEYVLVSAVDITRHKRSQAALRDLAARDPLSGLANRRWFDLQLAQHLRLCADEGPRGALLVVDLDRFKKVNDTFGHHSGDRLIIEVAVTLRRHLRDQDVIARLGGDEFAVVLREGDRSAAESVARKLVLAVRDEVYTVSPGGPAEATPSGDGTGEPAASAPAQAGSDARGGPRRITVSIGVAPFELMPAALDLGAASASREVLRAADTAMYAVKRSGRNGYAVAGSDEVPHHARSRRPRVPDLSARSDDASQFSASSVPAAHLA